MNFAKFSVLLGLFVGGATAFGAQEFIPIQERAQGHSLVGANLLNDSLYTNPASAAFTQAYSAEASYLLPKTMAVSILDTRTSQVGGGIGYFRSKTDFGDQVMQGVRLALTSRMGTNFGFGVTGKYMWGPNLAGASDKQTDFDIGALTQMGGFQAGLVMRNALGGNARMGSAREVSLGARYGFDDTFFVSAAATSNWSNFKPYEYGFGAEYVSKYFFSVKGGYRFQPDARKSFMSGGLSFNAPKFAIHYSLEIPNQSSDKAEHMFATSVLF